MFLGLQVKSVFVMQFTKVFCFKLICHLILVEGETVEGETTPPMANDGGTAPRHARIETFFLFSRKFLKSPVCFFAPGLSARRPS